MTPYYQHAGITIYNCDCREILPDLQADAIITDPIWPGCEHIFPGVDAQSLLAQALDLASDSVNRVVIHLGNWSDPRFLAAVPQRWPFLRACYLEFAVCSYRGRIVRDADIAYAFGSAPPSEEGARVIPGRVIATNDPDIRRGWRKHRDKELASRIAKLKHPAARHIQHAR